MVMTSPSRHGGDRAADRGLGGDVAGHEAAGGAGEAAVGEQRDLLAQAEADERRGHRQHLAHPGAAARALVADHDDVAGLDRRRTWRRPSRPPRARTRAPGPRGGRARGRESFTTEPSGARLPRRMARPPVFFTGSSSGRTTSWPGASSRLAGVLADRPAGDGLGVLVEDARLEQALGDDADAARVVEVLGHEAAAGLEVARRRRGGGDAVEVVDVELDAGLAGEREQVQDAVGRAAAGGDRGDRVLQPLAGDDVARALAAGEDVHDQRAGTPARPGSCPRRRRGPSRSPSGSGRAPRRPSPSCWR